MRLGLSGLRTWCKAIGGNVTITFALSLIPIVGCVGAAVDYSRANAMKAAMQAAVDATALMLSKNAANATQTDMQTKGFAYYSALMAGKPVTGTTVNVTYKSSSGSQVTVAATGNVKTEFMGMIGMSSMKVAVDSQVKWGNSRLRVALALDTTGSMDDDGKIEALKKATKALLDQLKAAAVNDGDVYVSIIPFSKDVNVGKSKYNSTWLRWDLWDDSNGDCDDDGSSQSKSKAKCKTKGGKWKPGDHSTWNGCVTDRDQDYDTKNTPPNINNPATLFPTEQYSSCPAQLMELSYDWGQLKSKVDSLYPAGNTNQGIGIAWAYQSLTSAPFVVPSKDPNYKYSDVVILMSDGLNTENRFSGDQSDIDARELITCTNAKNAGITIYTVQVNTGGDPTMDVMRKCASSTDKFTEIKKANQLVDTFTSIGTSLSSLRLSQ